MSKQIPKIRFKEFTDEWEQRKWIDTVDMSTNMVDPKSGEYDSLLHIGPGNIESFTGRILNNVKTVKEDNLISGKFHFIAGDIIYGKINPQLAKYTLVDFEGLASADTYVLNAQNDICQSYLYYILQCSPFYRYSVSVSMRTGMPKINRNELNQFSYSAPKLSEQQKIGELFKQLDDSITLHIAAIQRQQDLKKAMLQKLFPIDGMTIPTVRFSSFSEEWEQRKLGELGSVSMNKRIFKDETSDSGDIPFYKIGTFGKEPDAYISRELFQEYKEKYPFPEVGDILISASGSIGRTVVYQGKDEYFQDSNIVWLKHDERLENLFLKQFYSIVKWNGLEGSTIKRLYNKNILDTDIILPNTFEQKKIGIFFKTLDNTITLHQQALVKLKSLKQSLLQKMFI